MASRSVSRSSEPPDERLVVALVRGVHGLRGAVRVEVLTDRPEERFREGAVLYREGSLAPLTIGSATSVADGPGWRLTFVEVPDRTAAERLMGAYLEAVVERAAILGPDEYLWHEVIDTPVRDAAGRELGRVADIYRAGEAEVLLVRGGPAGDFDVPVIRGLIRSFEPRRGEIVVDVEALGMEQPAESRDAAPPRPPAPRRRRRRSSGDGTGEPDPDATPGAAA